MWLDYAIVIAAVIVLAVMHYQDHKDEPLSGWLFYTPLRNRKSGGWSLSLGSSQVTVGAVR